MKICFNNKAWDITVRTVKASEGFKMVLYRTVQSNDVFHEDQQFRKTPKYRKAYLQDICGSVFCLMSELK